MQPTKPHITSNNNVQITDKNTSFYPTIVPQITKTYKRKKRVLVECQTTQNDNDNNPNSKRVVSYNVGQSVDVFCDGFWRKGKITRVLEGFRYLVMFDGQDEVGLVEVCGSQLRVHRDCDDGFLVPPFQEESCPEEVKSNEVQLETEQGSNLLASSKLETRAELKSDDNGKGVKLRIKYANKILEPEFSPGATVEVRSDEDGYQGSWYTATIVGSAGVGKFLVEYKNLVTDDETELLKEVANEHDIRPLPPDIPQSYRFEVHQEVDAWYNDGWWEGVISEVLDDWNYGVYFASTGEKLVYQHSILRPHQNWVHGKWVLASQKTRKDLKCSAEVTMEESFTEGAVVEVRSDEEGYQGSWYTATIVGFTAKDKLLVEYLSLKTNDGKHPLKEEVSLIDVRPSPPWILHVGHYKRLQEVDVWYDDGWWVGVISEVLKSKKYIVCFGSTGVKQEFDHVDLRPHQDWINGKWTICEHHIPRKKTPSNLKLRATSSKRKCAQSKFDINFGKGSMVEVKSDEPGYEGSWYSAIIVKSKRYGRFLVEYLTLKTEDEKEFLREDTHAQNIRPYPPEVDVDDLYHLQQRVDAWYNDGWWVGVIAKILAARKYTVYFVKTREEMIFDHVNLRPHQEWVNGKWIAEGKETEFPSED